LGVERCVECMMVADDFSKASLEIAVDDYLPV
jgi:hypothetical protein